MDYYISDLHFGHDSILKFTKRPWTDLDSMNEGLIKRWNERVKSEDTVYILGDLALCSFKEFEPIAKRLNGVNKYLILGNHDHYSVSQYKKLGFTVFHELKILIAGKTVRLSHYPYALPWYKRLFAFKSELRFMDRRPPKIKGEWLMHGHCHTTYKRAGNRIHVGVEAWGGYPVSAKEIESLICKGSKSSKNNNLKKKS